MLFAIISTSWFYSPLPPPLLSYTWDFYKHQLKFGGDLDLFTLSLCLPLKVALFFLLLITLYLYINTAVTFSWIALCRKTKAKVEETSSLTNFKIIPRNLKEIVLSWIPSPTDEKNAERRGMRVRGLQCFKLNGCAADFSLLNLPKGKSLGRSKPATNS
jgi:hypothetical protein